MLSPHVETRHSIDLVASGGFGYLLKDRVLDVDDFLDALSRVAAGGSALDPEVVGRLLMAEGRTNLGIAKRLDLSSCAKVLRGPWSFVPIMSVQPTTARPAT